MSFYILLAVGLVGGILIGNAFNIILPIVYVRYLSIVLLACLDSVLGGIRSNIEGKFENLIFVIGLFSNSIIAIILVYMGDKLAIDLYLPILIIFGMRIFNNLVSIRRLLLKKLLNQKELA